MKIEVVENEGENENDRLNELGEMLHLSFLVDTMPFHYHYIFYYFLSTILIYAQVYSQTNK